MIGNMVVAFVRQHAVRVDESSACDALLCYAIALAWYAVASTQDVLCRVVPRGVNLKMSDSPLRLRRSRRTRYANATVQIIV